MKLKCIFIMALLSLKLNAFDLDPNDKKKLEEIIEKTKVDKSLLDPKKSSYYSLLRTEEINNDNSCPHCPKYLLLTDEVNKIVDKINSDLKQTSDELPVKVTKLKFMFYEQALRERDGKLGCKRFHDLTPDLKPTKFDGQFKLLAEDVLKFNAVSDIYYMNPDAEETVYYYRGEGEEKNIIVQAILTKKGGKLRYYRYTPSKSEENPYNLPELGASEPPKYEPRPADNYLFKDPESAGGKQDKSAKSGSENYQIKFKTEVERRNKFIPNNVHLVEAKVDQDIIGDVKLQGTSDVSLTGNKAKIKLKKEGDDLVLIDLNTKINGSTEHKITVPFAVKVYDETTSVKGRVETSNGGQVLNLSLVDKGIDLVRGEFRRNADSGATSYVLARDVKLDKNEVLSMQYGKGEDDKQYASIKHAKTLKDNITLVLDVRVDQDRKASLYYQVSAKF